MNPLLLAVAVVAGSQAGKVVGRVFPHLCDFCGERESDTAKYERRRVAWRACTKAECRVLLAKTIAESLTKK
jgi:hypothetical protein